MATVEPLKVWGGLGPGTECPAVFDYGTLRLAAQNAAPLRAPALRQPGFGLNGYGVDEFYQISGGMEVEYKRLG